MLTFCLCRLSVTLAEDSWIVEDVQPCWPTIDGLIARDNLRSSPRAVVLNLFEVREHF